MITLCQEEVCPVFTKQVEKEHWPFPDPAVDGLSEEASLKSFCEVASAIKEKLLAFGESRQILKKTSF